jgi:hypothetical protein
MTLEDGNADEWSEWITCSGLEERRDGSVGQYCATSGERRRASAGGAADVARVIPRAPAGSLPQSKGRRHSWAAQREEVDPNVMMQHDIEVVRHWLHTLPSPGGSSVGSGASGGGGGAGSPASPASRSVSFVKALPKALPMVSKSRSGKAALGAASAGARAAAESGAGRPLQARAAPVLKLPALLMRSKTAAATAAGGGGDGSCMTD